MRESLSGVHDMSPRQPALQRFVILGRRAVARGWSPLLLLLASIWPRLRAYSSSMANGTTLYLDLSQRMCHGLFFLRGQPHEYGTERVMRSLLRPGDTFVDVGANVGYYSVLASRIVGSTGTVLAVEPQPAALSMLALNGTGRESPITVVAVGASDETGSSQLWVRPEGDKSSLSPGGSATPVSVPLDTLDHLCAGLSRVTLLKIDVEGHELQVLRGARSTISRHRPWICFELLEQLVRTGAVSVADLSAVFRELDYVCHYVCDQEAGPMVWGERSQYVLATPREGAAPFAGHVRGAFDAVISPGAKPGIQRSGEAPSYHVNSSAFPAGANRPISFRRARPTD
jgi:FkbM family methyltransferase